MFLHFCPVYVFPQRIEYLIFDAALKKSSSTSHGKNTLVFLDISFSVASLEKICKDGYLWSKGPSYIISSFSWAAWKKHNELEKTKDLPPPKKKEERLEIQE